MPRPAPPVSGVPRAAAPSTPSNPAATASETLAARFGRVRARSVALAAPLSPEDAMVQSMEDASPAKWHLAHTTWFFERFVLGATPGYQPVHPQWDYLFNSYYQAAGPMHARPQRGLVSRPGLAEVLAYRDEVDARVLRALERGAIDQTRGQVLLIGTHHEQQHQELLLTDIKHALWSNPLQPAYRDDLPTHAGTPTPLHWQASGEAIVEVGAAPWPDCADFAFDSESPRHRVLVAGHALASRPASNAEYRAFIDDGGYADPNLWLSEGWERVQHERWARPLYWDADGARAFTLGGWRAIDPHAPVCHLSYYEADAFARWAGARLPTEFEWERAAAVQPPGGHFADDGLLHPHAGSARISAAGQWYGDVWEWTSSAYAAYPGFRPLPGVLGEYNGKFMCGQWVLRGGSCATPRDHVRASYRNFFPSPARWQFSGVRLARDVP